MRCWPVVCGLLAIGSMPACAADRPERSAHIPASTLDAVRPLVERARADQETQEQRILRYTAAADSPDDAANFAPRRSRPRGRVVNRRSGLDAAFLAQMFIPAGGFGFPGVVGFEQPVIISDGLAIAAFAPSFFDDRFFFFGRTPIVFGISGPVDESLVGRSLEELRANPALANQLGQRRTMDLMLGGIRNFAEHPGGAMPPDAVAPARSNMRSSLTPRTSSSSSTAVPAVTPSRTAPSGARTATAAGSGPARSPAAAPSPAPRAAPPPAPPRQATSLAPLGIVQGANRSDGAAPRSR
jgi:hypothetical protein